MSNKIRILLADDHTIMRIGLTSLLSHEKDMSVVGEAENGEDALALAAEKRPDVVILDLMMPGLSGSRTTSSLVAGSGDGAHAPRVIILTSYATSMELASAVKAGASAVVLKDAPSAQLIDTIRRVHAGERIYSDDVRALLNESDAITPLAPRQLEILRLASKGFSNQDIARTLQLKLDTVKKQCSDIFQRLGAANRAEAVNIARSRDII